MSLRQKIRRVLHERGIAGLMRVVMAKSLKTTGEVAYSVAEWIEVFQIRQSREDRSLLARNRILHDRHRAQRCFIIGNGPSLQAEVVESLRHDVTFVMNGFWRHSVIASWQPTYYAFADNVFFDGTLHSQTFFHNLRTRISSSTFLVPLWTKELINQQQLLPLEQVFFLPIDDRFAGHLRGRIDLSRVTPYPIVNTSLVCLLAAIWMGCSPIYLLGFDHDWLAHREPDRHFYGGQTLEGHPGSAVNATRTVGGYASLIGATLGLWRDYEFLSRHACARGIKIYNATVGGFLDVFERVYYDEILENS